MFHRRIYLFVFGIFLIKCLLSATLPLFADEAYYYVWSLFPQLSYYDHPAMVSWLIVASTSLFKFHNPLAVRILFALLSSLTLVIWLFILKKKNFDSKKAFLFLALVSLNPLLGIGSILATPDVPLVFFWSLSYLFYLNVLEKKDLRYYALLGMSLGLGFCSKYHIVLFVLFGALALVLQRKIFSLRLKGILLTLGAGFVFSLPVVYWNYQHEWVSFLFQLKHGFGRTYYKPEWTTGYIVGQILILSPFVFAELFNFKKSSTDRIFSLSQIGFFISSTFKSVVEANWPITAHTHGTAHFIESATERKMKWTFFYWGFVYLVLIGMLFHPAGERALKNQFSTADIKEVAEATKDLHPLYGPTYQISSLLTWESQKVIPKLASFSRRDFFNDLPQLQPQEGEMFYVLKEASAPWPEKYKTAHFEKLRAFEKLELELYQVRYE